MVLDFVAMSKLDDELEMTVWVKLQRLSGSIFQTVRLYRFHTYTTWIDEERQRHLSRLSPGQTLTQFHAHVVGQHLREFQQAKLVI